MVMKNRNLQFLPALVLLLCVFSWVGAYGQITPSQDAYTTTATPTKNFGAATTLDVKSSETSYIQFNLASIPSGFTSTDITKATLKLYVDGITTAGSFNVDFVNGSWAEDTIDASNAPALGTTIAASVPLTKTDKNQYILVDITPAVQAWLSGTANDGIALVANSPLDASFDSKEATKTSHTAELDVVFSSSSGGGIAGINTASGSGLMGGGDSGTINLSLINTCSSKQILQWNGSAWACSNAGTGTITGVTAGAGLSGGGSGGNVTLGINTSVVPQLNTNNIFTGSQGVVGNLSVTTPSSGIHGGLGNFSSSGAGDSNSVTVSNGTGTTETFQSGGPNAFVPGTNAGDGGLRVAPGKNIFFGDSNASRLELDSSGNAFQPLAANGMAKAMFFYSPSGNGKFVHCFNSTLSGAAATTPPCGFSIIDNFSGDYILDLGFQIDDRFISATAASMNAGAVGACTDISFPCQNPAQLTPNRVEVTNTCVAGDGICNVEFIPTNFYLIVY
jgi:hypothetical protein